MVSVGIFIKYLTLYEKLAKLLVGESFKFRIISFFVKSSGFLREFYHSFARQSPNEILRHRGSGMLLTCSSNTSHARLKKAVHLLLILFPNV